MFVCVCVCVCVCKYMCTYLPGIQKIFSLDYEKAQSSTELNFKPKLNQTLNSKPEL